MTAKQRQRMQATARRLRDEGKSIREIAAKLRVSTSTVHAWLKVPRPVGALAPPPRGNQRARKHGAFSEQALAPLRDKALADVRLRFPTIDPDDGRLHSMADRMARIGSGHAWLKENDHGVVRDNAGRAFDIADRIDKWQTALDRLEGELRREAPHGSAGRPSGEDWDRLSDDELRILRMLLAKLNGELVTDPECAKQARVLLRRYADEREAGQGVAGRRALGRGEDDEPVDAEVVE